MVARWVDNSAVTIASTGHGVLPVPSVQRYSQAENLFVCLMLNGTSAPVGPLVPR